MSEIRTHEQLAGARRRTRLLATAAGSLALAWAGEIALALSTHSESPPLVGAVPVTLVGAAWAAQKWCDQKLRVGWAAAELDQPKLDVGYDPASSIERVRQLVVLAGQVQDAEAAAHAPDVIEGFEKLLREQSPPPDPESPES